MPFKKRSFPPGWRPLDRLWHWSGDDSPASVGLTKICSALGIGLTTKYGVEKDDWELINGLLEHYGLPHRDAECYLHDPKCEDQYLNHLRQAERDCFELVEVRRSRERPDLEHGSLNLTTLFYINEPGVDKVETHLVRVGPRGCNCLCKFSTVSFSISLLLWIIMTDFLINHVKQPCLGRAFEGVL